MHVSDLTLPARIETTTDAIQVLSTEWHHQEYIARYGDVLCEYEDGAYAARVPSFADDILAYTNVKASAIARHGSN